MKIAYEPHPVTPERKAELKAQGFKIIDARFAPEGHRAPAEASGGGIPAAPADVDALKKGEVRELLDAHGVEVEKGATVQGMREQLKAVMFVEL
tara:strand:+ start:1198 stop:1479 length:282 start_codon:yes stop_codon:yes gene_type:complete